MVIKPLEGEGDSQGKKSAKLYLTLNTRKEKSPTALWKKTLLKEKCVQAKTDAHKIFLHFEYLTCLKMTFIYEYLACFKKDFYI